MIRFLLFAAVLIFPTTLFAQQNLLGHVYDANTNLPLIGASVVNDDKSGTISDENGKFLVECGHELQISFMGYETKDVQITDCTRELKIFLKPVKTYLQVVNLQGYSLSKETPLKVPSAVVELNQKEIKRGTGLFLDDAINTNVPGVIMSRRGVSSGQQFNIRGYGNGMGLKGVSNNFDTRGTKVYLNGILLTNAEGISVLDAVDFSSIGNVEVLKGPSGTLYGQAIAGVVKLQTLDAKPNEVSIAQDVLIGEYGLRRYTTSLTLGTENASLLLQYGHQESDGFMAHTASEKDFVNVIGNFNPNAKQKLSAFFSYSDSYDARGGQLTLKQWEDFDYSGKPSYIKNNAHTQVVSFRAGLNHNYKFSDQVSNSTSIFGSGSDMNSSSSGGGWSDESPVDYGFRSTFNFDFDWSSNVGLSGVIGLEMQAANSQPIGYKMIPDETNPEGYNIIGKMRSNTQTKTGTSSYFTEWILNLPQDFSITAGIGWSQTHIELEDRLYDPNVNGNPSYEATYGGMFSPHLAINKVFNDQFSAYAAYSKAYLSPVSSNIVISETGELNTDLHPEKGGQFEVGSKGNLWEGRFQYQLAVFRAEFKDKMTSVAVPLNEEITEYTYLTNAGSQVDNGVELLLKMMAYQSDYRWIPSISPWGNFTYSDFTYKNYSYESYPKGETELVRENYDGKAVAGVSPITANVGIDFYNEIGFYGNVEYSYRDPQPIVSSGEFKTDAIGLLNAKLGFRKSLGAHFNLDVFAGARNITGTQHYFMIFVNQLSSAYLPAPYDVNFYSGVNIRYIF